MVKRMLPDPFGCIVVSAICPFEASSGSWLGKLRDLDMQNKTKSSSYIQCGLLEFWKVISKSLSTSATQEQVSGQSVTVCTQGNCLRLVQSLSLFSEDVFCIC